MIIHNLKKKKKNINSPDQKKKRLFKPSATTKTSFGKHAGKQGSEADRKRIEISKKLERGVQERTSHLALTNESMRREIAQRKEELTGNGKEARRLAQESAKLAEGITSQIAGAVAAARLFSEHKRVEEALRESEEKYRTILENIEDAYYEVDLRGNFKFFNDSLCRMLGYSRNELMSMDDPVYRDHENARKMYQVYNQVYRTGKPVRALDWEIIRKDGKKAIVEASISLMKDSGGRPCGISRNCSERDRAQASRGGVARK